MNTTDCKYYEYHIQAATKALAACTPITLGDTPDGDYYLDALNGLVQHVKHARWAEFYGPLRGAPLKASAGQRVRARKLATELQRRFAAWHKEHEAGLLEVTEAEVMAAVRAATMDKQQGHADGACH